VTMRMFLLFLALFSVIALGQRLCCVRALETGKWLTFLKGHAGNRDERCSDVFERRLFVDLLPGSVMVPNEILHMPGHHSPMFRTHMHSRGNDLAATHSVAKVTIRHERTIASARARRQGLLVLSNIEESANNKSERLL
jgi:hypothetical protein